MNERWRLKMCAMRGGEARNWYNFVTFTKKPWMDLSLARPNNGTKKIIKLESAYHRSAACEKKYVVPTFCCGMHDPDKKKYL